MDFSRTRLSWSRPLTDYTKVQELIGRLKRNNPMFFPKVPDGAYVNIGCGNNLSPGYVNIDWNWKPGVDICLDVSKPLPFRDGSIGGVFSEHCLEHLPLASIRAFLTNCRRVMRPGAWIRIVVPDLEMYARSYVDALDGRPTTLPNEYFENHTGVNKPVALINELFYGPAHRFICDYATFAELLGQAGFVSIARCKLRQGSDPRLLIDDPGHKSESVYLEARQPDA
jgi:SAM-dependent methyltransferase